MLLGTAASSLEMAVDVAEDTLSAATAEIGKTQAELHNTHLQYHLTTLALLTSAQLHRYAELRGYASGAGEPHRPIALIDALGPRLRRTQTGGICPPYSPGASPQGWSGRNSMLSSLDKVRRVRWATMFAVVYALCVVAPAASFALGDAARAAYCLTQESHGIGAVHVHSDGASHKHSDGSSDEGKAESRTCCGLACFFALAPSMEADLGDFIAVPIAADFRAEAVLGRGQDRLNRPPISL